MIYKVKVSMKVTDEKTGKIKFNKINLLVDAVSVGDAEEKTFKDFSDTMNEWEILSISDTSFEKFIV